MAAIVTGDIVAIRKDWDKAIHVYQRKETPFGSTIGSEKMNDRVQSLLEDELGDPTESAHAEGSAYDDDVMAQPIERTYRAQIFKGAVKVSETVEAVDKVGREREGARLVLKRGLQLKQSWEYAAVKSRQAASFAAGISRMAGVQNLIDPSMKFKTGGSTPFPLTEERMMDALEAIYKGGGDDTVMMVTPKNSRTVAKFVSAERTVPNGPEAAKIWRRVDLLRTPTGQTVVQLNHMLADGDTFIYVPDRWKKLVLRDWKTINLAKNDDADKVGIRAEMSLKHTNFKAAALITEAAAT